MKSTTFNGFIAVALLVILALAPMQFAFADDGSNTGFFSSLRERQVTNREKVKVNLLQLLSSNNESGEQAVTDGASTNELANIAYQLADITDRLEARIIILTNQGTEVSQATRTTLESVRNTLTNVSLALMSDSMDEEVLKNDLANVRTDLQTIIAELKTIIETTTE